MCIFNEVSLIFHTLWCKINVEQSITFNLICNIVTLIRVFPSLKAFSKIDYFFVCNPPKRRELLGAKENQTKIATMRVPQRVSAKWPL